MKKIVNWTFGSVFRTFGRVLAYILIGTIVALLLSKTGVKITSLLPIMRVKAAETINVYAAYNGYNEVSGCSASGKFNYDTIGPNVQGSIAWSQGNVNTAISGKAKNIYLAFKYDLEAQKTYDLTITFYSNDLTNKLKSNMVSIYDGDTCGDMVGNHISMVSFKNTATSSSNTNKLVIRVYSPTLIANWGVALRGGETAITSVSNFGIKSATLQVVDTTGTSDLINNQNNNTNTIIDNNTENTTNIINNQNQNTQDIINNQNQQSQNEIASQNVCYNLNERYAKIKGYLNGSGEFVEQTATNQNYTSDYISLNSQSKLSLLKQGNTNLRLCFYNESKTYISCIFNQSYNVGDNITIPTNAKYLRFVMKTKEDVYGPNWSLCSNGNQAISDSVNNLNDNLNNDDTSEATSEINDFFSNFSTNNHGLTGIISAPLNAINSLTSKTCSPLVLPLPFVNQNLTLPCMRNIYVQNFGAFMNIYDVITLGIISYWVMVRIFNLVKDFKNPEHDEIEVMDL